MSSPHRLTRRQFVSTAAAVAGASLAPTARLFAAPQDPAVDALATQGASRSRERIPWKVEPFSLSQVRLLDGPFKRQMESANQWVLGLPNDRLLHTFRLNAGLPSSAEPLGGWEKPDCELRGHLVGGQEPGPIARELLVHPAFADLAHLDRHHDADRRQSVAILLRRRSGGMCPLSHRREFTTNCAVRGASGTPCVDRASPAIRERTRAISR